MRTKRWQAWVKVDSSKDSTRLHLSSSNRPHRFNSLSTNRDKLQGSISNLINKSVQRSTQQWRHTSKELCSSNRRWQLPLSSTRQQEAEPR